MPTDPSATPDGAPEEEADRHRAERPLAAPLWLELVGVGAALVLASVGSVGLLLAIHERYTTAVSLLIGLPIAIAGTVAFALGRENTRSVPSSHRAAVAALAIALGFGLFYAIMPSQHVVVTRDPGSYINTARWLVREGRLGADARGEAFAGVGGLQFAGAAVYDMGGTYRGAPAETERPGGSGQIEYQFNHLSSVAMAASYDVGGHRALFRLPAAMSALSLVLVYAAAVRVTRRTTVSLLAPLVLATSMPFLYVARTTYSEAFASVLLWAAVLVSIGLHRRPRMASGATAGLLMGALISTRVDAMLYVALVLPVAAVSVSLPGDARRRRHRLLSWGSLLAVTAAVGAIGWVDLNEHSGLYVEHLSPQIRQLRTGLLISALVSVVGALVWLFVRPLRRLGERARRPVAVAAAVLLASLLLFGWLIRPEIQTVENDHPYPAVVSIQERDGLSSEPDRNYAESSMRWMSWYLGVPAIVLALGALVASTWRTLARGVDPATLGVLVLCLGASGLYWYMPEITPDHPWATRRFVPAAFPALAIWAAAGVGLLLSLPAVDRQRRRLPAIAALGAAAAIAAVVVAPPVLTTRPVREQRLQAGYLRPVLETCDALPEDAAVIAVGGFARATLANTIRTWCGVPVAATPEGLEMQQVIDIGRQVSANGYRLHLVSPDRGGLTRFEGQEGPPVTSTSAMHNDRTVRSTLDRPPHRYQPPEQVLPVPTPFALHVLEVDLGS